MTATPLDVAAALVLLAAVTAGAWTVVRSGGAGEGVGSVVLLAPFAIVWWSLFLGSFLLLGLIELLGGHRPVAPSWAALAGTALAAAAVMAARLRAGGVGRPKSLRIDAGNYSTTVRLLAVATLAMFLGVGATWLLRYPSGFESQAYVLPYAVDIFTERSLALGYRADAFTYTYPANFSIYYGFLLGFLPEPLAGLANLPVMGLLALSVYSVGRALGAARDAAALTGLGVTTVPIFGFFAFQPFPDPAAVVFVGFALALVIARPRLPVHWALLAGLAILVQAVRAERPPGSPGRDVMRLAAQPLYFGVGFLLTAGFWLARAWIELGNPLYPLQLPLISDLLGWQAAPEWARTRTALSDSQFEWVRSELEWLVYPWVEWHMLNQNFKMSSGFGAFVAATLPLALAGTATAVYGYLPPRPRDGSGRSSRTVIAVAAGGAIIVVVWWLLDVRQPRYLGAAFAFLLPVAAWVLTGMTARPLRLTRTVLTLCALFMVFVIGSSELVRFGSWLLAPFGPGRAGFYQYPAEVDRLPPGSIVANLYGRTANYPLLGEGLTNRVIPYLVAGRALASQASESGPAVLQVCRKETEALQITHLYIDGRDENRLRDCPAARLQEVARLDRNPNNGRPLPSSRVLYRIDRDAADKAGQGNKPDR